ncbi:hypothetical protein ACP4OV_005749 [Aristida adscensionis]
MEDDVRTVSAAGNQPVTPPPTRPGAVGDLAHRAATDVDTSVLSSASFTYRCVRPFHLQVRRLVVTTIPQIPQPMGHGVILRTMVVRRAAASRHGKALG